MNHAGGYITDFFMEGNVDDLINIFSDESIYDFPEKILTNSVYSLGLENKCNFIVKLLDDNIDIYWHKPQYWLSINKIDNNYMNTMLLP
jgi:hypothetical protein